MQLVLLLALASGLPAAARTLNLRGVTVELEDVTAHVDVYYRSMRFNRAANVWNVEVLLSNKSSQTFSGPLVYYVAGFTNTTGPLQPDGRDGTRPFYDLSATVADGALDPREVSLPYTLSLGVSSGAPQLSALVFARPPPSGVALAVTRTLNDLGQPLSGVTVTELGPAGTNTFTSDPVLGFVTLGQS
ncbi:MAG: hypothetical protein RMK20_07450, partial [Verrucomicrobiales bacterium]|nr:hypothetical protein [Verrucomicrobiales bacterium]